jgi:hypothetical protein
MLWNADSVGSSAPRSPEAIRRRAKLFEAGRYEDRNLEITPSDLSRLAQAFSNPIPILTEHGETPLSLGELVEMEALGRELYGTLAFSPEAHALIERCGARALSVGLAPDLSEVREVSLVRNPRVADARLFASDSVRFSQEFHWDFRAEVEALRTERFHVQADAEVNRWLREGRLIPAQAEVARALLRFARTQPAAAESVRRLIDLNPARNPEAEIVPSPKGDFSAHLMLPEEAEFYRRYFPDVRLEDIARGRRA